MHNVNMKYEENILYMCGRSYNVIGNIHGVVNAFYDLGLPSNVMVI